jgi:hypothetical protein
MNHDESFSASVVGRSHRAKAVGCMRRQLDIGFSNRNDGLVARKRSRFVRHA